MKVTYSWLKELVDVKVSAKKLADLLTMAGLNVDSFDPDGKDAVYDIEVTSNRPDWLSVRGVAREVAAVTKASYKPELKRKIPLSLLEEACRAKNQGFSLQNSDPAGCRLYVGILIEGVGVSDSPVWLKKRLQQIGLRSINNVVDLTNYCLMEFGQPLHAFDFDKLDGQAIIVRRARDGETISLIDGSQKKLDSSMLVIADRQRSVALAGIMGGSETQVTQTTRAVLLESACFDPVLVRRASRKSAVSTDSSYRFERGRDLDSVSQTAVKACGMITQMCGGRVAGVRASGPLREKPAGAISLSADQVNDVLSLGLKASQIRSLLSKLGFEVSGKGADRMKVVVPPFRKDVRMAQDLIEEVGRVYGYEKIPRTVWTMKTFSFPSAPPEQLVAERLKQVFTAMGVQEVITYSLISEQDYSRCGLTGFQQALALENPLSQDRVFLRTTLLPSLLECVAVNINRGNKDLEIFEAANVYSQDSQVLHLGVALCGNRRSSWLKESRAYTFFDLKGMIENGLAQLQIGDYVFEGFSSGVFQDGGAAKIVRRGQIVGILGLVSEEVKKAWGIKIKEDIILAQMDLAALARAAAFEKKFSPLSTTPSITRDISLIVPRRIHFSQIHAMIQSCCGSILRCVSLAEYYTGSPIPQGSVGMTLCIEYGLYDKTLCDDDVAPVHEKLLQTLIVELGVTVR